MTVLTGRQIADEALAGWVHLCGGLQTRIRTGDFTTGLRVLDAIGAVAEQRDHHPDLTLRYASLDVRLRSHDVRGVTQRDIGLARAVTAIAAEAGVPLDPAGLSRLRLALDTPEAQAVLPFWGVVLGLRPGRDLEDPAGVLPDVWFQQSGTDEPRQRWHPDVWVDPAEVQPRIEAALAAGGALVGDEQAPRFWVLADPQGNRVCLCTWQGRD